MALIKIGRRLAFSAPGAEREDATPIGGPLQATSVPELYSGDTKEHSLVLELFCREKWEHRHPR